jgi:hypothetical protein
MTVRYAIARVGVWFEGHCILLWADCPSQYGGTGEPVFEHDFPPALIWLVTYLEVRSLAREWSLSCPVAWQSMLTYLSCRQLDAGSRRYHLHQDAFL